MPKDRHVPNMLPQFIAELSRAANTAGAGEIKEGAKHDTKERFQGGKKNEALNQGNPYQKLPRSLTNTKVLWWH